MALKSLGDLKLVSNLEQIHTNKYKFTVFKQKIKKKCSAYIHDQRSGFYKKALYKTKLIY